MLSPFSSDPMVLLAPGLRAEIQREAHGMDVKIELAEDKFVVSTRTHSVGIPYDQLLDAFHNDNYDRIKKAANDAVRYLRSLICGNYAKRRAFRAKQRSILIHRRFHGQR